MNQELLGTLMGKLPSSQDKELFLEAVSTIGDSVSRRIILKAAGPTSPVAIDEFADVTETTMIRHLHLLHSIGILEPIWEGDKRKFAITSFGRQIAKVLDGKTVK